MAAPPTTTAATTTAPPTTATRTPEEIISERHLAFADAIDECFMDPAACDPAVSFTGYLTTDNEAYRFYASARDELVARRERMTQQEKIKRRIVESEIQADRTSGHTINCIENGSVNVPAGGEAPAPFVSYGREDFFWKLVDGEWIVTEAVLTGLPRAGDGVCSF